MTEATVPAAAPRTGGRTYADTVSRGFYGRYVGGLSGKWDNVRTFWEDEIIRLTLRPFVSAIVSACEREGRRIRIVDLGCGAGQGYDLLTGIPEHGLCLEDSLRLVLTEADVACYLGLDISEAMIAQGRENYPQAPHVRFERADLRDGLGPAAAEAPFDIYFSSYGSLSHLAPASLHDCLAEIACHARPGALVVLDLIGRLSPEWPGYWEPGPGLGQIRDYSMSYLYAEDERRSGRVERMPLSFWTGPELDALSAGVERATGRSFRVLRAVDRSIFVGRHVDTGEYDTPLPPLRALVNRLLEPDERTALERLRVVYPLLPQAPDGLNAFLSQLAAGWTCLVDFTIQRLRGQRIDVVSVDGWPGFPPALQTALLNMDRVLDGMNAFRTSDVRANIVEPQLAYLLRDLEMALQTGRGCGHGLLAVAEVGARAA